MNTFLVGQSVTFVDETGEHSAKVVTVNGTQVIVGSISPAIGGSPTVTKNAKELTAV